MIKRTRAEISQCIIHKVANKFNSGHNAFSNEIIRFDEESYDILKNFLLKPFTSLTQSYRFLSPSTVSLTEVNNFTTWIFNDDSSFVENSKKIVNHLFEQSNSAQIKTGDVLVVHFEGIQYKEILTDAVGVFKIENKEEFLQTYLEDENFDVAVTKGISTKRIDKGCLILNTSDGEGTVVLSVDNNNYDAQYWIKNFLNVKFADNNDLHTQNYLQMCKEFSEEVLLRQGGKQEQCNVLSKHS
ncbi:nucleoid-associated protein [Polaribacter sejongensis]|uniref:nucleoid-associated protein n=1 Tax=Polaribacter sejongensis TaxID=985043 RepID=UPI0035A71046